jgi:hypothetical protein
MIEPMLKMVHQNPEMFGGLLGQLQVAFMSNCFCAGSYSVYLHSNAEENGYSIHFIPFQQGLPTVQAELVFDNDSSYTTIAYSYGWPLDHGLEYAGNGTFDYLNGFEPLYHQGDTSYYFSTQASLPYDSLYAGFNTRVYVQPDTADRYKFYRNRSLNQDSTLSYSTYTGLSTADTLVVVTEISEASTLFTITCTNNNSQQPAVECDTISFPVNRCVGIDTIIIPILNTLPGMYFRSRSSGLWNEGLLWQVSQDSSYWYGSNAWPDYRAKSILIREGDTISFPMGFDTLSIAGHLNVQGQLQYNSLANTVIVFTDTLNQAITSSDTLFIKQLTLNKGQNAHVFLSGQLAIHDTLNFVKGIVYPDSVSYVLFGDTAIAQGASDVSYVNGAVQKKGNSAFTFPVGKDNYYRPIAISAPGDVNDLFTGEFFYSNSSVNYSHTNSDTTLQAISKNEYWRLYRNAGTSNVIITLSWDTLKTSCSHTTPTNLRVSGWDGSVWQNYGRGTVTGNIESGLIQNTKTISNFTLFTLASTDSLICNCNFINTSLNEFDIINSGDSVLIGVFPQKDLTYQWTPTMYMLDSLESMATVFPESSVKYLLNITDNAGCGKQQEMYIFARQGEHICGVEGDELQQQTVINTCDCYAIPYMRVAWRMPQYTYSYPLNSEKYFHLPYYNPNNQPVGFIPEKTFKVNLIVIQSPEDPELTFSNNPQHIEFLTNLFNSDTDPTSIKNIFLQNAAPSDPMISPELELSSTGIRIELENLYFIPAASVEMFETDYYQNSTAENLLLEHVYNFVKQQYGEDIYKNVNCFFIQKYSNIRGVMLGNPCTGIGTMTVDDYINYKEGNIMKIKNVLSHELAHLLRLDHTYDSCEDEDSDEKFDYLSDVYGTDITQWQVDHPCPHPRGDESAFQNDPTLPNFTKQTNNIMASGFIHKQYFSPLQVAKMHRSLSLYTNMRKFISGCPYSSVPIDY